MDQLLVFDAERAQAISAIASTVIALTALLIAALSLFVSFRLFREQAKHNALSVRPSAHVRWILRRGTISVIIENNGLGPMVIEALSVMYKGSAVESLQDVLGPMLEAEFQLGYGFHVVGNVIAEKERYSLFQMERYEPDEAFSDADLVKLITILSEFSFHLYYKDFYDNSLSLTKDLKSIGEILKDRGGEVAQ